MTNALIQGPSILIWILLLLGPIVIIHELGHYWAGRMFGAAAESFSVGFGKPIFERRDKRNTRWRFNWLPFGGFVAFVGESQRSQAEDSEQGAMDLRPVGKTFMEMNVWQRSVVAAAGPLANFITAILLYAVLAFNFGGQVQKVTVDGFAEGPAEAAGFQIGDVILSIDGKTVPRSRDIQRIVMLSSGDELTFQIMRDGVPRDINVVPERQKVDNGFGQEQGLGRIGLSMQTQTVEQIEFGAFGAIGEGVRQTGEVITTTGKVLGRLVTGREPITQLSGPVGMGDFTNRAVGQTMEQTSVPLSARLKAVGWTILQIAASISVGVGLVNLLPLPVLDGGHLVMNAYEAVTGALVPEKIQALTLRFGMIFILTIAAIVTVGDIAKTGIF